MWAISELPGALTFMAEYDLDHLSSAYDHRPISDAGVARAQLSSEGIVGVILDIGGGRGEHTNAMRSPVRTPIVVDIAESMAARAQTAGATAVVGSSANLPFNTDTASLAYFHLSIHYGPWRSILDEAMRVVRPGGRIDIWTFNRQGLAQSSLAQWFPRVVDVDVLRFPDPDAMATHLSDRGASVLIEEHVEPADRSAAEWESAVRARFVSTLQMLSGAELDEGLGRFRRMYPNDDDRYRYDVRFVRITCQL
jgi:SAM-dependent methyltransferase